MSGRTVYMIEPWKPYFGDSGQINGLSGCGGYHDEPIKDELGNWLQYDTYEEAEAEALKRGYDRGDVVERTVIVVEPDPLTQW